MEERRTDIIGPGVADEAADKSLRWRESEGR